MITTFQSAIIRNNFFFPLIFLLFFDSLFASNPENLNYFPIIIKCSSIEKVLGEAISDLHFYASKNGAISKIPFQLDSYDKDNFLILNDAGKTINKQDQILFLYKDLGDQIYNSSELNLIEIKIPLKSGIRFLYLLKKKQLANISTLPEETLVKYDTRHDIIDTPFYYLSHKKENPMLIEDFLWRRSRTSSPKNHSTGMHADVKAKIWNLISINKNENDHISDLQGKKQGNFHTVRRVKVSSKFYLGIKFNEVIVDYSMYPSYFSFVLNLKMPFDFATIFSDFSLIAGISFRNLQDLGTIYLLNEASPGKSEINSRIKKFSSVEKKISRYIGVYSPDFGTAICIFDKKDVKIDSYPVLNIGIRDQYETPGIYLFFDNWTNLQVKKVTIKMVILVLPHEEENLPAAVNDFLNYTNPIEALK